MAVFPIDREIKKVTRSLSKSVETASNDPRNESVKVNYADSGSKLAILIRHERNQLDYQQFVRGLLNHR